MKKIRFVYLLDLFERRVEKGHFGLVCVERLWMIRLMVVMLMSFSRVVNMVLVILGVGPILRSRYEIK